MKLKSYLRGIGAGMIVAALIMGVAAPKGNAKTPSPESRQTLLETVNDVSKNTTASVSNEQTTITETVSDGESEQTVADVSTDNALEGDLTAEVTESEKRTEFVDDPVPEPEPEGPPAIDPMPKDEAGYVSNGETVLIKVIRGDSSVSVARRIFEAGLVESAVEFDRYLCDNHYDKSISVGEYEIENGADFETIAKTITRRN